MKGVELPINTLVIVVIAVMILLALVAMYFTGFGPFSAAVGLEGVRGEACRKLAQERRCTVATNIIEMPNFDANKNNANNAGPGAVTDWTITSCPNAAVPNDNLAALCKCYYSITSESDCKRLCGCP